MVTTFPLTRTLLGQNNEVKKKCESFNPASLGMAEEVVEERVADEDVITIKRPKSSRAVSVVLRGAHDYLLDEIERSLHDALSIWSHTPWLLVVVQLRLRCLCI